MTDLPKLAEETWDSIRLELETQGNAGHSGSKFILAALTGVREQTQEQAMDGDWKKEAYDNCARRTKELGFDSFYQVITAFENQRLELARLREDKAICGIQSVKAERFYETTN